MIKTTKELRVFQNSNGFYVRPVTKKDMDRGLSLTQDFETLPDGLRGDEYLVSEFNRIRKSRSILSLVLLAIFGCPHIYLSLRYGRVPLLLSIIVLTLSTLTLVYQAGLFKYRYQDCVGNVFDVRDGYLQLKDGARIRVMGGH